jgi:hypothetical protein
MDSSEVISKYEFNGCAIINQPVVEEMVIPRNL